MTRFWVIVATWILLAIVYMTGLGGVLLPAMYPRTDAGAGTFLIVLVVTSGIALLLMFLSTVRAHVLSGVVFLIGWMPLMGVITEEVAKGR